MAESVNTRFNNALRYTDEDGVHQMNVVLADATDAVTNAVTTVSYEHHEVHSGSHFSYNNAQDLTNGQTVSFLVVTPDTTKWSHFGFLLDGEAEFDLQMFEDATPDADGSAVSSPAVINSNRNSATTPTLTITSGPTVGGGSKGTLIKRWHSGNGKQAGGSAGTGSEVVLKQNTKYWFDLTNSTTSNNFLSWDVEWYEHTDKA